MKIGPSLETTSAVEAHGGGAARTAQAGSARARPTDQVEFSAAGTQMGALGAAPDFDQAKVNAIREAMREGRFTVNPEAIADKLIADATALLGARAAS